MGLRLSSTLGRLCLVASYQNSDSKLFQVFEEDGQFYLFIYVVFDQFLMHYGVPMLSNIASLEIIARQVSFSLSHDKNKARCQNISFCLQIEVVARSCWILGLVRYPAIMFGSQASRIGVLILKQLSRGTHQKQDGLLTNVCLKTINHLQLLLSLCYSVNGLIQSQLHALYTMCRQIHQQTKICNQFFQPILATSGQLSLLI